MIDFTRSRVPVRKDIPEAMQRDLQRLSRPGGSLRADQRMSLAESARAGTEDTPLGALAAKLYSDPADVIEVDIEEAAADSGYPPVVETIGIVSRLAAVDRFHQVLGLEPPQLPEPTQGEPTGEVTSGLKKRSGHVPMPSGSIPVALDLVPAESRAMLDLHGAIYMTAGEMGNPRFARRPGLDTPQLEAIAARVSYLNKCFY